MWNDKTAELKDNEINWLILFAVALYFVIFTSAKSAVRMILTLSVYLLHLVLPLFSSSPINCTPCFEVSFVASGRQNQLTQCYHSTANA